MIIDLLQPALASADRLNSLSDRLKRTIDSARRGQNVDPWKLADQIGEELKALRKALPRKKGVARAA